MLERISRTKKIEQDSILDDKCVMILFVVREEISFRINITYLFKNKN